ncbi:PPK2 family polyphosphate kinase [Algoriphagus sp. CAU 1675]|uniref:PPK2 family polyphosphate kinase n=1 Tax=Algoriphagus sp. CAU 1675 TaxID=3032597 RepID=UPI0023DBEDA7|nr:PPK2 family polyphosphate kinase [Algoriphagus sp. CAU 1675]MDF2159332.1 polyphosphate kinase 2 family protein [Algoriphagus sp. CAU 1675]
MKNFEIENLKVHAPIKLEERSTFLKTSLSDEKKNEILNQYREELSQHQDIMYAQGKYAVLICLQGMDTSGKDSLIREVFKEFNPRGVIVHSFKNPTELELKHDFLWRHYLQLPARGKYAVFNRTYYENVLVTRVHPEYILNEHIPGIEKVGDITPEFWDKRLRQINDFEKHLSENGTIILKFFLHMSKEEQRERLLRRLENEKHHWKFSPGDLKERELWKEYHECYEEAINKTSTSYAPWYIIPSDDKETSRLLVAQVIHDKMMSLKGVKEPELSDEIKANFALYKKMLRKN